MSLHDSAEAYLARIRPRLEAEGFTCAGPADGNGLSLKCMARRGRFELTKFGYFETFFLFSELAVVTTDDLWDFSSRSFRHAHAARSWPLPCGLLGGMVCFAVGILRGVAGEVADEVRRKTPPRHWGAFELPVIYDLASRSLLHLESTPAWGAAYFGGFRKMAQRLLAP